MAITDILYISNFILAETAPFVTGSGTTAVIYEPWVLGPTNPFITGSGTLVEFKDMLQFIPPTRSANLVSGSVSSYSFNTLTFEESAGLVLGTTSMPAGKPYKETIIVT
jgi:hypothetical protein